MWNKFCKSISKNSIFDWKSFNLIDLKLKYAYALNIVNIKKKIKYLKSWQEKNIFFPVICSNFCDILINDLKSILKVENLIKIDIWFQIIFARERFFPIKLICMKKLK